MRKKFFVMASATVLMAVMSNNVHAQASLDFQNFEERKQQFKNQVEERVTNRVEERTQNRCETVGLRINNRLTNFEANKDSHVARYQNMMEKLNAASTRLEEAGQDVSTLNTHITTFDSLVKEYTATYVLFISQLEDSKGLVCGESEGQYKEALQEAKSTLQDAKQQRRAIGAFYFETIRPELRELISQVQNSGNEVTDETNQ